jgi:hypothetical protein
VAAINGDKLTAITYHSGAERYLCELIEGVSDGGTGFSGKWNPIGANGQGARIDYFGFMSSDMVADDDVPHPAGPHLTGFGFAAPDVVSVEARIGGKTVTAEVADGMFTLWSTESFTSADFDAAILVATTASGDEIVSDFP